MWPSKISNGPPKNRKGAKHGPQNYWPGDNTEPSRKDVLPSKIRSLYKKMGPQFQWWDPHHIQSWVPRTPKHSTWCKPCCTYQDASKTFQETTFVEIGALMVKRPCWPILFDYRFESSSTFILCKGSVQTAPVFTSVFSDASNTKSHGMSLTTIM